MNAGAWPGVFTGHLLHRVSVDNAQRVTVPRGRARLGLADCRAVCTPASAAVSRRYCRVCWPDWPQESAP
jgi:hypothetical protein